MEFENRVLVGNRLHSWVLRGLLLIIALMAGISIAFLSLKHFYQNKVNHYFLTLNDDAESLNEDALIISSARHQITSAGNTQLVFKPLLAKQLGEYQSHEYTGWHASYEDWKDSKADRLFFLRYQVTYENGTSQETFLFSNGQLTAREVILL